MFDDMNPFPWSVVFDRFETTGHAGPLVDDIGVIRGRAHAPLCLPYCFTCFRW